MLLHILQASGNKMSIVTLTVWQAVYFSIIAIVAMIIHAITGKRPQMNIVDIASTVSGILATDIMSIGLQFAKMFNPERYGDVQADPPRNDYLKEYITEQMNEMRTENSMHLEQLTEFVTDFKIVIMSKIDEMRILFNVTKKDNE